MSELSSSYTFGLNRRLPKLIDTSRCIGNEAIMADVGSDARLTEIAYRFSELEHVEAVALAGSAAVGNSDSQSDLVRRLRH